MRQHAHHDSPNTGCHTGTSVPIVDLSKYDLRAHSPACRTSGIGVHAFTRPSAVHPATGRVQILGHERTHTVQQTTQKPG